MTGLVKSSKEEFGKVSVKLKMIVDYSQSLSAVTVKHKRWPDWGLNPGPSRHIPDALTTELSGLLLDYVI